MTAYGNEDEQLCEWFAFCANPATHTQSHPIIGPVPICDRCQEKYDNEQ